jgi:hypothetical protein
MNYGGKSIVLAVAQKSFELGVNTFSTLVPVAAMDGTRVSGADFPNRGLVWRLVRGPRELVQASPGRLVIGTLEASTAGAASGPDWDQYQLRPDTSQLAGPHRLLEIVTIPPRAANEPRDIINRAVIYIDHEPTKLVLARWKDHLYGPFSTEAIAGHTDGEFRFHLSKTIGDRPVRVIPNDAITSKPGHVTAEIEVSWAAQPPNRGEALQTCRYEFVMWDQAEEAWSTADTIRLVTDDEALRRAAQVLSTKATRKELLRLVDSLVDSSELPASELLDEDRAAVTLVRDILKNTDKNISELLTAVVQGGHVQERLDQAIQLEAARATRDRAAVIQADAEQSIAALLEQRDQAQKELASVEADLQRRRRQELGDIEKEIAHRRQTVERELAATAESLQKQRQELDRQRSVLEANIGTVIERFRNERDEVVNDFLALQPIFQSMGLLGSQSTTPSPPETGQNKPHEGRQTLEPPSVIYREDEPVATISELEFFERLCNHVEACGFQYQRTDLVAFHTSVKCGDLTVLGGVSGTGKSSLPRLYSQALGGAAPGADLRFLPIDVSPSWTSPADALGYLNVLDRCFMPSSSGLFTHLVWASMEHRRKGSDSGLYVICLDELNLAQPEHYLSGLLQALSRSASDRVLTIFDAASVASTDPSHAWARIPIAPNVRFVGTVNFDETTRPLSQRFLDRTNLIELLGDDIVPLGSRAATDATPPTGPLVASANFNNWINERPLGPEAAQLLADIQGPLGKLGCPLTPRRQIAIARFLSSTPIELCSQLEALDLQVALRVLPQIKGVFTSEADRALNEIASILERHGARFERSLRLIAVKRRNAQSFDVG